MAAKKSSRADRGDAWERGAGDATPFVPDKPTLPKLREAAAACHGCHLFERGTQTVFGEGALVRGRARVMFVGEQPGDREDLEGKPFVGPAGTMLDRAMVDAGIDRKAVYVTNAVKHFKWEPRGKRRLHSKPNAAEISACRPWLDAEIAVVKPDVIVCLGATAAQALLGKSFRVTKERGKVIEGALAPKIVATVHPSSLLREPDEEARHAAYAAFVADLKVVARELK